MECPAVINISRKKGERDGTCSVSKTQGKEFLGRTIFVLICQSCFSLDSILKIYEENTHMNPQFWGSFKGFWSTDDNVNELMGDQ